MRAYCTFKVLVRVMCVPCHHTVACSQGANADGLQIGMENRYGYSDYADSRHEVVLQLFVWA
jgi:hypothetical protein